jgi:hypothetical protein
MLQTHKNISPGWYPHSLSALGPKKVLRKCNRTLLKREMKPKSSFAMCHAYINERHKRRNENPLQCQQNEPRRYTDEEECMGAISKKTLADGAQKWKDSERMV